MVGAATALALLCGASPWAESPVLLEKATDPSFSAIVTSDEVLHRSFADPAPRPSEFAAPSPGRWRWMGRSLSVLDPTPPDSFWHIGFGNEVGDNLFRESSESNMENRNPAMWFSASTPSVAGTRGGVRFDQVDHFSDRMLGVRTGLIGSPILTDQDAETRRAFFGENIPGHSIAGAEADMQGRAGLAARTGWIWLSSPGAGELQCWQATTTAGTLRLGSIEWGHAEGWFDRADTAHGSLRQSQGWITGGPVGEPVLTARAGLLYGSTRRSGDVSWMPDDDIALQPWLMLSSRAGSWHAEGVHQMGTDFFLLRDTVGWSEDFGAWTPSVLAGGQWTDRPDGAAPWKDSSTAGVVRMESRALEQTFFGDARLRFRSDRVVIEAGSSPWCVVHPRAFDPTGFATFAGSGDDAWVVRAGSERPLRGTLWGWKSDFGIEAFPHPSVTLDMRVRFDPVLGGPQGRTDLVAPVRVASAGLLFVHRSGLSVRPVVLWRDEAILRHRSPGDWTVPSGFDANLWIDQEYLNGRLVFSMAALNILSDAPVQAPNGAEDRARLMVQMRARPF